MQDCTEKIMRLREMARHVWNAYFRSLSREVEWDDVDDLNEIARIAFRAAFDMERDDNARLFEDPLPWLEIKPRPNAGGMKLLVNPEARTTSGFFGDQQELPASGSEVQFVSLFDFDLIGFRDMSYLLVFVSQCESRRDLEQHYALLPLDPNMIAVVSTESE